MTIAVGVRRPGICSELFPHCGKITTHPGHQAVEYRMSAGICFCCSERQLPVPAQACAGDTLGSDEPAVYWGADIEESDKAVAEVKSMAKKPGSQLLPVLQVKRQDMGDLADSRCVFIA